MSDQHIFRPNKPSPEALTLEVLRRIDALCVRFEEAWQQGTRPSLEEYLVQVPEAERAGLLPELLNLDLHYADLAGQCPTLADYLARLPQYEDLLRQFFFAPDEMLRSPRSTVPRDPEGANGSSEGDDSSPTQDSAPASQAPLPAIPGYEIVRKLGRGGMGVVYLARHVQLKRQVALKMILSGSHATVEEEARFLNEAEAVAALRHSNIVQVYEIGQHQGQPFMALEYVPGGTLAQILKEKPLAPRQAAQLLEQLARGMNAAHQAGIVHRDLKPGNVLLTTDGVPKVTDFGLAKRIEGGDGVTMTGAIVGTARYMAPEQANGEGKRVGPTADVYALGAILYECLTGRPPFQGDSVAEILRQVTGQEPTPPHQLQARLPKDLETICLKCLQKEPRKRYASADALAEDLRRWQANEPIRARPVSYQERIIKWGRRRPAVAALLLLMVLGVPGIVWKYVDAEQQRGIAESKEKEATHEAAKAKMASDFLVSIFELSNASGHYGAVTARQILADAEKRIPLEFADQPELQAELLSAIESVYDKITAKAPIAMILEVSGTVQLKSNKHGNQPLLPQMLLYAGDRLHLAADAQVQLVFLCDLHKERLTSAREVTLRRKGCEPADAVHDRDSNILMTFVPLPKGTFYMGGGGGMVGKQTEITEDFEIAVHDVTQGQWQAVMGNNPSYFSRFGGGQDQVKDISDEELKLFPVEQVSWDDAQAFIKKLNAENLGSGYVYRLPTAAEWEYACRGGATAARVAGNHRWFPAP
jgi:serine/threonine protein kinase